MRSHILTFAIALTGVSLWAQAPPVPAAYQDLYNSLSTQIASFNSVVNAGWDGSSYPYLDAPQLISANSNQASRLLGANYNTWTVTPELSELQALGANAVTIHINFPAFYQPYYAYEGHPEQYQEYVTFYQQLAQEIRGRGMKLVVEASLGMPLVGNQVASLAPYLSTLSWSEYMAGRAANALAVAQLIAPDYMTVMTESDSEANVSGQTNLNNVTGVTQLVQQVLTALQQANVKNVKVGAGVGTWTKNYTQYVQAFVGMPLDFVDMHIYPINRSFFTAALTAADTIHAAGKEVGLSETWTWKIRDSELGTLGYDQTIARDPFSFWAPVDAEFLQAIVNFAKYKQLAFISPYWVHYFFAYLDYNTYASQSMDSVLNASYLAATDGMLAGAFTSTGLAWESMNVSTRISPPAIPAAPTAPVIGTTGLNLAWTADNGATAYNLYRNGALIGTTSRLVYYDTGLVSGATYTYRLSATDVLGHTSGTSTPLVVATVDVTPPSVPAKLVVTGVTPNSISLNWNASTGIGGVGGYRVLRGTSAASMSIHADVTAPPYTDPYATPSTTYYYQVESYNPKGIPSVPGNLVTATSAAPLWQTPPSVPTKLAVTSVVAGSPGSITLNWTPSTSPAGVAGYKVLRGTSPSAMAIQAVVTTPPYTDPYAAPSTTYYYQVESYNAQNVTSGPSNLVTVTSDAPVPPSVPSNLKVTSIVAGSPGSISLNWTPSTSPTGVAGYKVLRGTSPSAMAIHGSVTAPPYTDPYAAPSTTYYYQVESYSPQNVTSGPSNLVTVTSDAPLWQTPPSVPTNLVITSVVPGAPGSITINWAPSSGPDGVGGYRILEGNSPGSMAVVANVIAPPYIQTARQSTAYYFQVESYNPQGVTSAPSNQVTTTTPAN